MQTPHRKAPGFQPKTFLLQGDSSNHCPVLDLVSISRHPQTSVSYMYHIWSLLWCFHTTLQSNLIKCGGKIKVLMSPLSHKKINRDMTFIVSRSQDFQKTQFSLDLNHSGRFFLFIFLNPYLHNYDLEQPGYTENCSTILNKYINKQCTFWNILYFVYFWSSLGKEKGFTKFFLLLFFFLS